MPKFVPKFMSKFMPTVVSPRSLPKVVSSGRLSSLVDLANEQPANDSNYGLATPPRSVTPINSVSQRCPITPSSPPGGRNSPYTFGRNSQYSNCQRPERPPQFKVRSFSVGSDMDKIVESKRIHNKGDLKGSCVGRAFGQ